MFSNRIFQAALLISVIAHGVILLQNRDLNLFTQNKTEIPSQINYLIKTAPKIKPILQAKQTLSKKSPLAQPAPKINIEKLPPKFIDKEGFGKLLRPPQSGFEFTKPSFIKASAAESRKKISLPPLDIDKINNPSYLSYYQIVREKIKRAAYQNCTEAETGEVYLSFIISSDGNTGEIRILEDRSDASPYLKEAAFKSIKDATPFPPFPKELDYPQLSFNVAILISYETE